MRGVGVPSVALGRKQGSVTAREQRVWDAAYAAAFAAQVELACRLAGINFDLVIEQITAERAAHIADLAVKRLREWQREEDPRCGRVVR